MLQITVVLIRYAFLDEQTIDRFQNKQNGTAGIIVVFLVFW